jgi:PKD repeat protein
MLRASLLSIVIAVMLSIPIALVVATTVVAEETGAFPSRTFTVVKAGEDGPDFRTGVAPDESGLYSVWLDEMVGSWTRVRLYQLHQEGESDDDSSDDDEDESDDEGDDEDDSEGQDRVLLMERKLKSVPQQAGPLQLVAGGTYELTVSVDGRHGMVRMHESYDPTGPTACFEVRPTIPTVSEDTTFDAMCSSDPDPNIMGYEWDFGDGSTAEGAVATHSFSTSGTFVVALTVEDALGDRDVTTRSVSVRPTSGSFFVRPHSDSGYDVDGDGLFNFLVIEVHIQVEASVSYHLTAEISAGSERIDFFPFIESGSVQTVPLSFDGIRIRESGMEGPYSVSLVLEDYFGAPLDVDSHLTSAYTPAAFDFPPATLAAPFETEEFDTDGDGTINWLATTIQIEVLETGLYEVQGSIRHPDTRQHIAGSGSGTFAEPGTHAIELFFDGVQIFRSGLDGPYSIDVTLRDGIQFQPIDERSQLTRSYAFTDFEPPSARFAPPFAETLEDTDGDGSYNFLVVVVEIEVLDSSTFWIVGTTSVGSGPGEVVVIALDAGFHEIALHFDGVALGLSGQNGPYPVHLTLADLTRGGFLGDALHETAAYDFAIFQPPGAWLGAEHGDVPVDADANGFYESLEVRVSAMVERAGWYRVGAGLISADFEFQRFNSVEVFLEPGEHLVSVSFFGYEIRSAGKSGAFLVFVDVWNYFPDTGIFGAALGSASLKSREYDATQFE